MTPSQGSSLNYTETAPGSAAYNPLPNRLVQPIGFPEVFHNPCLGELSLKPPYVLLKG